MRSARAITAVLFTTLVAGCSIGPLGEQSGGVSLTVTRDFAARALLHGSQPKFPKGETVMRYLQRKAKVKTRYGGRFVEAIDGISSHTAGRKREDWLYYVNGTESDIGAAEKKLSPGDRIWWDYHDWSATLRIPAVVGSFPEPFLHGQDGKRFPVRVDCGIDSDAACEQVNKRLQRVGVDDSGTAALGAVTGKEVLRLVIGTWKEVRLDPAVGQLEQGPKKSGVYARPSAAPGGFALQLLGADGNVIRTLGPGGGLVAATRFEEQQPTWVVSGTDRAGLDRAVRLLDEPTLRDHFAIATDGRPIRLPVVERAK